MMDERQPLRAHFSELKRRLVWSVLVLLVAIVVSMAFHRPILRFLLAPAENLNEFTAGQAIYTDLTEFWGAALKVSILAGIAVASPFFRSLPAERTA